MSKFKVSDHVAHRTDEPSKVVVAPVEYEKEIYQRGLDLQRPPFTFQTGKWQEAAEARMSAESRGYVSIMPSNGSSQRSNPLIWILQVSGNAGTFETTEKNHEAFRKWSIVPKRLISTPGLPDLSVELKHIGVQLPSPIAVAPVGVQRIFSPTGEIASTSAAADEGVPYIMSTASSTSIEDVATANGHGTRWFQLYWPLKDEITASILSRANKAGFSALVVTLDTYILGWRPTDMDNG